MYGDYGRHKEKIPGLSRRLLRGPAIADAFGKQGRKRTAIFWLS